MRLKNSRLVNLLIRINFPEKINGIWPRYTGYPDLPGKPFSPKYSGRSGFDCTKKINMQYISAQVRLGRNWNTEKPCHLEDFFLDFHRIGWIQVIHPPKLNIYQCAGKCLFPFPAEFETTANAIMRGVWQRKVGTPVREPCCVPNQLDSHTLIFKRGAKNYLMKTYDGLIVKNCDCR